MNDKKILIALSPLDQGVGLVSFTEKYVSGENLDITIFVIRDKNKNSAWSDETVDALYLICATKLIPFRIKEIDAASRSEFADHTAFADLLIIEQNALNFLTDERYPIESSCAIVVLPKTFESISNVLLITDGSREALKSIKQFFQIFSRQARDLDVTLLAVADEHGAHMQAKDEVLLLNYVKQYCRNIGMLKVRKPLTSKILKPVQCNDHTVVVSSIDFFLEEDTKASAFNPLQDQRSILFLPTVK